MEERDTSVINQFLSVGDSADTLRLFSRGVGTPGCWVLGCWAARIARDYIKTTSVLKNWGITGGEPLHAVMVNDALAKLLIRDCLLQHGAGVAYYEKQGGTYQCVQQGTPGNVSDFEATLFEFGESEVQLASSGAILLTLVPGETVALRVGFAVLNTTLRSISVAEFTDALQLVNLDSVISQHNLRELYIPSPFVSSEMETSVRRLCERCNISIQTLPKKLFSADSVNFQRKLSEILRVPEEKMSLVEQPLAAAALSALLTHQKLDDETDLGAFRLRLVIPSNFLKLDAAAIYALHLLPQGGRSSSEFSDKSLLPTTIFGWLNRCATGMGSRLMRQWLLQPLRDVDAINDRLSMVELFLESPVVRDSLISQVLRRCNDMDRLNRRLQRQRLSLKELFTVLNFVTSVTTAVRVLKMYTGRYSKLLSDEFLTPLEEASESMSNLKLLVESTVDIREKEVRIKPEFDDDLQELDALQSQIFSSIQKEHSAVMRKYGWNEKQLKCEQHPTYGYVFRVSRKDDQQVRDHKELITINTSKDGVRFTSEKLAAQNDSFRAVSKSYTQRQQAIQSKLVETAATYLPVLDMAKELMAQLDVFAAWAVVVKDSKGLMVRPVIRPPRSAAGAAEDQDELLSLTSVRHPLVELREPHFQPNSVKLQSSSQNTYLITGPNMGGKSTLMRSVGVAVVMAQSGCFVCADAAEITVRDAVMCRVGATDHMSQGVSTFMVEMLESAAILSTATSESLVIVDELGRGTSTYDGFGLAWAIAEHLSVVVRCQTLFSTHFHEMTDMEQSIPTVQNMHFGAILRTNTTSEEEQLSLTFTYKLEPGPCERSYGVHVAALAKLPSEVVEEARQKAEELENFGGKVTERWKNTTISDEVRRRVESFVQRIQGCDGEEARQRLKAEILQDTEISKLLLD